MTRKSQKQVKPSNVDLQLLDALLGPEDAAYPWDVTSAESEAYFLDLEENFPMQDVLDEELQERSDAFYKNLDNLWVKHYNDDTNIVVRIQESLQQHFAGRGVPQNWLKSIAQKAVEVFESKQQAASEQLVLCVSSLLPTWGTEDLINLARPYAYATKSKNEGQTNNRQWTALSEIEQAKISLAIAHHALEELKKS
jgi:hypothetical protein